MKTFRRALSTLFAFSALLAASASPRDQEPAAILFSHPNFQGESIALNPEEAIESFGQLPDGRLSYLHSQVSSIQIFGNHKLEIFTAAGFQGPSLLVDRSISDLSRITLEKAIGIRPSHDRQPHTWDNQIASARVLKEISSPQQGRPPAAPSHLSTARIVKTSHRRHSPAVLFFQDAEMRGEALGTHEAEQIRNLAHAELAFQNWNDEISSIELRPGVEVYLYEHANFQGERIRISHSIPSLASVRSEKGRYSNWNDRASSVRVVSSPARHDHGHEPSGAVSARAYRHADFSGRPLPLSLDRDYPNLSQIQSRNGNWNDTISSIEISDDVIIELYTDINFSGERIIISANQRNLDRARTTSNRILRWNDTISSLRVIRKIRS